MITLCADVLKALAGQTLATAESLTGGGIGEALTSVPGASAVYAGGVISYTNGVKEQLLGVNPETLVRFGAVSGPTASQMARGVRELLKADVAVSVTGLAGPGGDEFGHSVGTVFIGYDDGKTNLAKPCHFQGDRQTIRQQTIRAALELVLEMAEESQDRSSGPLF